MNENPEGTPNPLNPNPEVAPTAPEPVAAEPTPVAPVAEPAVAEQPAVTQPAQPVAQPTEMAQPKVAKPKKAGLIVAIILCVVAIAAGVAAALIFINPFAAKKDAVPAALAKLMSGDAPRMVALDGSVSVTTSEESMPFSDFNVKFQASLNGIHKENYANAVISTTLTDGGKLSFNVDEVGNSKGEYYVRLSKIAEAINNYEPLPQEVTDCASDDESELEDCIGEPSSSDSILSILSVLKLIDDEWIRIQSSDVSEITGTTSTNTSPTQCLTDAASNMSKYGEELTGVYQQYPFINYTTENLKISQKKDALYLLSLDAEKTASFINALRDSSFVKEISSCMGIKTTSGEDLTTEEAQEIIKDFPDLYVEIDNNDNFTRVYFAISQDENKITVTVDLSLAYPSQITINEPTEYIDVNEAMTKIMSELYGGDNEDSIFSID